MNVTNKIFLICISFLLLSFLSFGQKKNKAQLVKDKKENLQKIKEAQTILSATQTKKNYTMGQLSAVSEQITIRADLIEAIKQEIDIINDEMEENNLIITSLQEDLDELKNEYAAMIYASYKANKSNSKLAFLFAAKSFNQLLMRVNYMKQYEKARIDQIREIDYITSTLEEQLVEIEKKRQEKNTLLEDQLQQNQNLVGLRKQQNNLVTTLRKREKQLRKEITARRTANEKLERMIASIVREEIRKSSKGSSNSKISLTPEAKLLSDNFAGNRSKLTWPVASGFISRGFGKQPHPVLKKVIWENKGVNIQTNEDELVRSVFDGKVSAVLEVPGLNNAVLVNHGDYFTVYANLKEVIVKPGQSLKHKDQLGKVFTDKDGVSELHFELWKNNQTLDPQSWLLMK